MDPVQAQVDAYNARDIDAFVAPYADDVVITDAGGRPIMAGVAIAAGIRPCAGALIVLVFALSQGLFAAGVAATFGLVSRRRLRRNRSGSASIWASCGC